MFFSILSCTLSNSSFGKRAQAACENARLEILSGENHGFSAPALEGKYFLVTGTGKYFKNVQYDPAKNLGIVRLKDNGATAELLWGFTDGGRFTSEFPAHMMSHAARLAVDPKNRVVMHCHPTNLLAMTYVHTLIVDQIIQLGSLEHIDRYLVR